MSMSMSMKGFRGKSGAIGMRDQALLLASMFPGLQDAALTWVRLSQREAGDYGSPSPRRVHGPRPDALSGAAQAPCWLAPVALTVLAEHCPVGRRCRFALPVPI